MGREGNQHKSKCRTGNLRRQVDNPRRNRHGLNRQENPEEFKLIIKQKWQENDF